MDRPDRRRFIDEAVGRNNVLICKMTGKTLAVTKAEMRRT